jgi:hypothetical protein
VGNPADLKWRRPCQTCLCGVTRLGMPIPETRYAKAGDAAVAYRVGGSGEHRVVVVPGAFSNVELFWEWPPNHYYLEARAWPDNNLSSVGAEAANATDGNPGMRRRKRSWPTRMTKRCA